MISIRRQIPTLILIAVLTAWSLGLWYYGYRQVYHSFIRQQEASAAMIGHVVQNFVLRSGLADLWDREYLPLTLQDIHVVKSIDDNRAAFLHPNPDVKKLVKTRWSEHLYHRKFAQRILLSAGQNQHVQTIYIVTTDGFIPWMQHFRGEPYALPWTRLTAEQVAGYRRNLDGRLFIEHELFIEGKLWGWLVLDIDHKHLERVREASRSNMIFILFIVIAVLMVVMPRIRTRGVFFL
jgi:hypothetical protein